MANSTVVRDLEGKCALVTGATSGIGQAAAMQLAAQGATVIVHGRDVGRGAAVVKEIESAGGSARFVGADLSQPAEALRLAAEVGEVDILVNNAGFAWFGPTEKLAANALNQLFAANVQAPYLLVSVLAPKMVARGHGVIINVASRAGAVGQPHICRLRRHQSRLGLAGRVPGRPNTGPQASASTPSRQGRSIPTRSNANCSMGAWRDDRAAPRR